MPVRICNQSPSSKVPSKTIFPFSYKVSKLTSKVEVGGLTFCTKSGFRELKEALANVAEQVINDVKEAQRKYQLVEMDEVSEAVLRQQILSVSDPNHKIRGLVRELDYYKVLSFFLTLCLLQVSALKNSSWIL